MIPRKLPKVVNTISPVLVPGGDWDIYSFQWNRVGPLAINDTLVVFGNARFNETRFLKRVRYFNYQFNAGGVSGRMAALISLGVTAAVGHYDTAPSFWNLGGGVTQNYPVMGYYPSGVGDNEIKIEFERGEYYIPAQDFIFRETLLSALGAGETTFGYLELSFYK